MTHDPSSMTQPPQSGAGLMQSILAQIGDQKTPPVDKWNPPFCGDIDMRIKADGTWFYMGSPIGRERMVKLFASVLRKDEDGKTYLVTPVEKIGIIVDDAPFVIVDLSPADDSPETLVATTNHGDRIIIDDDHPIEIKTGPEGLDRPYVRVRGRLDGALSRPAYYRLVDLAEIKADDHGRDALWVQSNGIDFCLGHIEEHG